METHRIFMCMLLLSMMVALCSCANRGDVMKKIYGLEMSIQADMSYLRDAVDTNRVSIDAILQLLDNSQSGAVVNQQQPETNNDLYDDARFSEELARFKRAFADEKAIAREQQANLMLGMSKLSDAISKHLVGITDEVSKLDNQFEGITDVVSNLDTRLTNIEQDIGHISNLINHSALNTADLVTVNVADVVGNMVETVMKNINASCNPNSKSLTKMYIGLHNELSTTSPCYALSANKELYPLSLVHFLHTVRLANASCSKDRLVGQGRVEVYHDGQWGTVCDDNFDGNNNGATVVCRSLGFSSGVVKNAAYVGQGSGNTWLDNVQCDGTEDDIFKCPRDGNPAIGEENCSHSEDVGVICR